MVVNLRRTRVIHPDGVVNAARFIYLSGTAAVWVEDTNTRSAFRVLYATDVQFHKPSRGREPMLVYTDDINNPLWTIHRDKYGGCGCGSNNPTKNASIATLLDPDISSL